MSLPVRLSPGIMSIYGASSINGILTNVMQFGVIDQLSSDIPGSFTIGDSVMFPISKIQDTITYNNISYFLIGETEVKLTENPLP